MRQNLSLLVLLLLAAVVFTFTACPYLHERKHDGLCVAVYVLIILAFIYGRTVTVRSRRPPKRQSKPD